MLTDRLLQNTQANENMSSVSSSRKILRSLSVNTGLYIDITPGILFVKVCSNIPHIPKGMLDEIRFIYCSKK